MYQGGHVRELCMSVNLIALLSVDVQREVKGYCPGNCAPGGFVRDGLMPRLALVKYDSGLQPLFNGCSML